MAVFLSRAETTVAISIINRFLHTHLQNITSTLKDSDFPLFRNFTRAGNMRADRLSPLPCVMEIIIITIIDNTALSEPKSLSEDSARFVLNLTTRLSLFYRAMSSALRPAPNLEDQAPVFMSPSGRVAQLYPQAPAALFVAFYDSQGDYGVIGGIAENRYANGVHSDGEILIAGEREY
jgi:hypothetical protein